MDYVSLELTNEGEIMEKTTKQRILEVSLTLFSKNGYEGVSIREIAAAVGIKGASIYNHFKSKEDICQGIFKEMTKRYERLAEILVMPIENDSAAAEHFIQLDEAQMVHLATEMFSFFAKDEFVVQFRKLLMTEQNRNLMAAKTLKNYYFDGPIQYQAGLFGKMQEKGLFLGYDAQTMALQFYSPLYYLLSRYDLEQDYDECIEELKKHVHFYFELYGKEN